MLYWGVVSGGRRVLVALCTHTRDSAAPVLLQRQKRWLKSWQWCCNKIAHSLYLGMHASSAQLTHSHATSRAAARGRAAADLARHHLWCKIRQVFQNFCNTRPSSALRALWWCPPIMYGYVYRRPPSYLQINAAFNAPVAWELSMPRQACCSSCPLLAPMSFCNQSTRIACRNLMQVMQVLRCREAKILCQPQQAYHTSAQYAWALLNSSAWSQR